MTTKSVIEFEPWHGELGWEVMTWAPWCRREAQKNPDKTAVVTSFPGMWPLYDDFASFRTHDGNGRGLTYPKRYRVNSIHRKYGKPLKRHEIVVHARGIRRKCNYNYRRWPEVVREISPRPGIVGTIQDLLPDHACPDDRGISIRRLMDVLAGAMVVMGVSSGIMHLAAACGTNLVVWGDDRTYFGETLEKRYKETWNPHGVRVEYLMAKDFQPEPEDIFNAMGRLL